MVDQNSRYLFAYSTHLTLATMLHCRYFEDFDPARHGHVTKNQFARAMGSLGFELTEDEVNLLAMKYCDLGNKSRKHHGAERNGL